jgi:V8-like Glu-specific endopeptidase
MLIKKSLLSLTIGMSLSGCGTQDSQKANTSKNNVYQGEKAAQTDGVFYLYGGCTAVLVAPQILLSAAHCFPNYSSSDLNNPKRKVYYETLNKDFPIKRIRLAEYEIRNQIRVHPSDLNRPGFDLAVLEIEDYGEIPHDHIKKIVPREFDASLRPLRTTFTIQGYGWTDDKLDGFANPSTQLPRPLQEGAIIFVSRWGLFNQEVYFTGANNACKGDSGGPIFLGSDNNRRLAAITIAYTPFYLDKTCEEADTIATNLGSPAVRQWISQATEGRVVLD